MELIECVKDMNPIAEIKQNVQSSGLPNVLYGAAWAGELVCDFLTSNDIKVDAVVIDEEYFPPSARPSFRGHKLLNPKELSENFTSINLFIGFYANNILPIVKRKTEHLVKLGG